MHSRIDPGPDFGRPTRARRLALLAGLLLLAAQPGWAADNAAPTDAEVTTALTQLKADPHLATQRTLRVLRWADSDQPRSPPTSFEWLTDLLGRIAQNIAQAIAQTITQTSRVIVWLAAALLAAVLVWRIVRLITAIGPRTAVRRLEVPTHVRDLDIRPASLPDDIGTAAFALWERGEHRAALSLLYRGLLSRLAHLHALPIRHSTTEGDCIELALQQLGSDSSRYVARLVYVWQQAAYGRHQPQPGEVRSLCNDFASALAPTTSAITPVTAASTPAERAPAP